jgi:hypothetical protein
MFDPSQAPALGAPAMPQMQFPQWLMQLFSGFGQEAPVQLAQNNTPPLEITPQIAQRFQRRLENANTDDALRRLVNDASKYGVDWSHLLNK